ncbi:unnamed protein product [Lepeophtheirus salmonis]|uniref:(salmon louse) hypothetical protein n=1 Tax=Lepeophtheirus salmonis TaxID=72036 RepID=A0A817FBW8_LEPSM|nr:unnamed protein product [Lepeophtheirus salmonis]
MVYYPSLATNIISDLALPSRRDNVVVGDCFLFFVTKESYVGTDGRVNDEDVRSFNGHYVGFSTCAPELNNLLCVDRITLTFKCRAKPAFKGIAPLSMLPNMEFVTPGICTSNHQKRWKQATTIDRVI